MNRTGTLLILVLVASAIVYQVLGRVPADALSVAVGVGCGLAASIPVTIGLVLALTRQRREDVSEDDYEEQTLPVRTAPPASPRMPPQPPQIIVIAPPQGQFPSGQMPGYVYPGGQMPWFPGAYAPGDETVDARDWRIIGDEPPS